MRHSARCHQSAWLLRMRHSARCHKCVWLLRLVHYGMMLDRRLRSVVGPAKGPLAPMCLRLHRNRPTAHGIPVPTPYAGQQLASRLRTMNHCHLRRQGLQLAAAPSTHCCLMIALVLLAASASASSPLLRLRLCPPHPSRTVVSLVFLGTSLGIPIPSAEPLGIPAFLLPCLPAWVDPLSTSHEASRTR